MAITATAGSSSANAYASVAQVDGVLWDSVRHSAWVGEQSTDRREGSIREATRTIEQLWSWAASPAAVDQALSYPIEGETTIPSWLVEATALLALRILQGWSRQDYTKPIEKLKRVGPISKQFSVQNKNPLPAEVEELLRPHGCYRSVSPSYQVL